MKRLRLYIADADTFHTAQVRKTLARCGQYEIIGASEDGCAALKQISTVMTDLVLLDLQLPGMDGLSLLKALRALRHPPVCIVCTRFYSDITVSCAMKNGATFVLYKPIVYATLPDILMECHRMSRPQIRSFTEALLNPSDTGDGLSQLRHRITSLGIPAKLIGCQYIMEAVRLLWDRPALIKNLSKGLYAEIANRLESTSSCVERSIRHAVSIGYQRGALQRRFPVKPSNKVFLEYLLEMDEEETASPRDFTAGSC